jgi:ubiquinone/menaquinone biosynthesis C-methylase UbiE
MNIDEVKSNALDKVLTDYTDELRQAGEDEAAVTLSYTHSLHRGWRTALRMLPVTPNWSVLDVGSGLGLLPFELAANLPLDIHGTDINPDFIRHADALGERLSALGLFSGGGTTRFTRGDAYALAFSDASFDLVFVRELLQFLAEPVAALKEVFRVLKPGGYLCIGDMDDQLRITWPPPTDAFNQLVTAVATVQEDRGGDRQVGRKLSTYLRMAGFEISSVVVLPEAMHRTVGPHDAERKLIVEQLHAARERVVDAGTMDAAAYDTSLAEVEDQGPFEEFRMNARIIVLGRRPADLVSPVAVS